MNKIPFQIGFGLFLTILVMRAPITGVGPIAEELRLALSMDYKVYGTLSSVPIICLGIFSLLTPIFFRYLSTGKVLLLFALILSIGIGGRVLHSVPLIFFCTILIGAGIAVMNTIVPVLLRNYFPDRINFFMGLYTALIGVSSTLGTYLADPVYQLTGSYEIALGIWFPIGLAASTIWACSQQFKFPSFKSTSQPQEFKLFLNPAAWSVFCTMGMQSLAIYTVVAWLPVLLISKDFTTSQAGLCTSLFVLVTAPASLLTSLCIKYLGGERNLSFLMTVSFIIGVVCWSFGGFWAYLGSILAGIPQGVRFSLALILISKKSKNAPEMLTLSSLAQFTGYILGGLGPLICGLLYHGDGNWFWVLSFFAFSGLLWGVAAIYGFGSCCVFSKR